VLRHKCHGGGQLGVRDVVKIEDARNCAL